MKICRFKHKEKIKVGVIVEDFIFAYDTSDALEILPDADYEKCERLSARDVIFLPPLVPSKIVCVGRNYAAHAAELGNDVPKEPLLFLKAPSSLILDGEKIVVPSQSAQVEHEGELAVIISRRCKNLNDNDNPLDYALGYTCLNDVTARDIQRRDIQFTRAKSFDTFCPVGSFVATGIDVSDLRITTKVNGIIKQDGRTSQMVFSIPFLLRYISKQMTLYPGDIIATGTPSGVSKLNPGDVCEIEIEQIGKLQNTVAE